MPLDEAKGWTDWDPTTPTMITVDLDGRVWFFIYGVGLYSYDGIGFDHVDLPGSARGVLGLRSAPDGSVWVVSGRGALYLVCGELGGDARPDQPG